MDTSSPRRGILASLEGKTAAPPQPVVRTVWRGMAPGMVLAAVVGLTVAMLLAWWVLGGPSPVIAPEAQQVVLAPSPPVAVPTVHDEVLEDGQAAAIINDSVQEPVPAQIPVSRQAVVAALVAAPAAVPVPQQVVGTPVATPVAMAPVVRVPVAAARAAATPPVTASVRRERRKVRKQARPVIRQAARNKSPGKARPSTLFQDSDVALLAALVAHADADAGGRRGLELAGPRTAGSPAAKPCASSAVDERPQCGTGVCDAGPGGSHCRKD